MAQDDEHRVVYQPETFEQPTLERAMRITLTTEGDMQTEERWKLETPYLVEDISKFCAIQPESCILDYGCGPGRMSKALIDKHGCRAVGVDTSQSMRLLAPEYVVSDRFTVWSPVLLDKMIAKGFRADYSTCLWVIQHAYDPMDVIARIDRALRPNGLLYALNQRRRCVPTNKGWVDDGFDVPAALSRVFTEESRSSLPPTVCPAHLAVETVIQVLRKKGS